MVVDTATLRQARDPARPFVARRFLDDLRDRRRPSDRHPRPEHHVPALGRRHQGRSFGVRRAAVPSSVRGRWGRLGQATRCLSVDDAPAARMARRAVAKNTVLGDQSGRSLCGPFVRTHARRRPCAGFLAGSDLSYAGGRAVRCSVWNTTATTKRRTVDTGTQRARSQFDGDGVFLRHWPRAAKQDAVNGWRFVRDEISCRLLDDGGTQPETSRHDSIAPAAPPARRLNRSNG